MRAVSIFLARVVYILKMEHFAKCTFGFISQSASEKSLLTDEAKGMFDKTKLFIFNPLTSH